MALALSSALALVGRLRPRVWLRVAAAAVIVSAPFALWLVASASLGFASGPAMTGTAATVVLKSCALATLAALLLAGGPGYETLAAAGSLGLPAPLVRVSLLAGRYLSQATRDLGRLRRAARLRGLGGAGRPRDWPAFAHLSASALVRSAERGERVAQALRCRGFDGQLQSPLPPRAGWRELAWLFGLITVCGLGLALELTRS